MRDKIKPRKKIKAFKVAITLGASVIAVGLIIWLINFFGIYSDASNNCLFTDNEPCTTKINKQADGRDIGEVIILVGVLVIGTSIFMESRTKHT